MGNQMMLADGGGGGGWSRMMDVVSDTQLSIYRLFGEILEADKAEKDAAVNEAGINCPERTKISDQFTARAAEYESSITARRNEINEMLHPFRNTANAAADLGDKASAWSANADKYKAIITKLEEMQSASAKWSGAGAASYWGKVGPQISATQGQQNAAARMADELEDTAAAHSVLTTLVLSRMQSLEAALIAAKSLVGGNGSYFRRSEQALSASGPFLDQVRDFKRGDDYQFVEASNREAKMTQASGQVPEVPPMTSKG